MPSDLSRALGKEEWVKATELAKLHPHQAKVWSKRDGFFDGRTPASVLPLHEAVSGEAPLHTVIAILAANPAALMERETSYGRLPLHCACRKGAPRGIIAVVAENYKQACLEPDVLDRLPIHYALSNGANPELIQFLLESDPRQARGVDHRGWTPLHVACSLAASRDVVEQILEIYPESVLHKTSKGHAITACLPKRHPEREDIKDLIEGTKLRLEETLKLHALLRRNSNCLEQLTLI